MNKAYKLFKVKKGKLYPLYVLTGEEVRIGVWLEAKEADKKDNGKVKSKIGDLKFRPGWHMAELPYSPHIGIKENGVIKYMHDDEVWCECEYVTDIDYQGKATANGFREGKFIDKFADLDYVPKNGYYRYKTNPNMFGKWIITGSMKVNRVLTDIEVANICSLNGIEAQPRRNEYDFSVFAEK